MSTQRALKILHASSTAFFLLSAAYVAILALRQAGVNWWVIFSLSGYSATAGFVLISAYLFAIFRGGSRSQACSIEHPLTSSRQYMILYSLVPFLGAFAGLLCKLGVETPQQSAGTIVMGTIGATFAFWILIDPVIAVIEMLLPQSRIHRALRIAHEKDLKYQQQKHHQQLLEQLEKQEELSKKVWQDEFAANALALADLAHQARKGKPVRARIVEIGLDAFKCGGIECMQLVHEMAVSAAKKQGINGTTGQYISNWWDGIGGWRNSVAFRDN